MTSVTQSESLAIGTVRDLRGDGAKLLSLTHFAVFPPAIFSARNDS